MKITIPSIGSQFPAGDRATFAEFPYTAACEYNDLRKRAIAMERALCRIAKASKNDDPVEIARELLAKGN